MKRPKLLKVFRDKPCDICQSPPPNDPAHIKSVGSGGKDIESNLLSLCRAHHREQHDKGWEHMVNSYPSLQLILFDKGFELVNLFGVTKLKGK
jgi:hypothetical protein